MSCDTFVIKSVFKRSFRIASSIARFRPLPISLTFSAILRSVPRSPFSSIRYSRLPDAICSIPFLILTFASILPTTIQNVTPSAARAASAIGTFLTKNVIQWMTKNALIQRTVRQTSLLESTILLQKERIIQSRLPFHKLFAFILRIRLI